MGSPRISYGHPMIDYHVDNYTAHFIEPLPEGLSRETLLRALAESWTDV